MKPLSKKGSVQFGGHFAFIAAAATSQESLWLECGLCNAKASSVAVAASAKRRHAYVKLQLVPETLLTGALLIMPDGYRKHPLWYRMK